MDNQIPSNERVLIGKLKESSRQALDGIYHMYARRLFAYCKQYTKSVEDAEEIVQDVFVRLWNSRHLIQQEDTLRSLLFTMSKNLLINAYRSRINSPVYEDYVDCREELFVAETHDKMEYEEFVRLLRKALEQLPSTQRRVIELTRLRELSNKEAAQVLELSEQTVKNQLSVGLKALRRELSRLTVPLWLLFFIN